MKGRQKYSLMRPRKIFILPILTAIIFVSFLYIPGAAAIVNQLDLGTANPFVILSGSVITNNVPGQPVTGDTGHISTLSNPFTHLTGSDFTGAGPLGTLTTAGTPLGDEHAVWANIGSYIGGVNSGLPCTFTFPPGAINLSTDVRHLPIGQYGPGVYCIDGAAKIDTAGIILTGPGPHVFKINGALTSVAGSAVSGSDGCNVFWRPTSGSLGENTIFQGTILSGAGAITLGADANLVKGRLVSESAVTIEGGAHIITAPTCTALPPLPPSPIECLPDSHELLGTCARNIPSPVGGEIIPVDMTSLFVAGAMTNAFWVLPTLGGIAGAAIALFKIKRRHS